MSAQVDAEFYRRDYDSLERWMSYWYQIQAIKRCEPQTVLEVGPGNNVIGHYLSNVMAIDVKTFDHNELMCPDYLGDVEEIDTVVDKQRFDVVACFQVLEHIQYESFIGVLRKFKRIAKRNVVLSIPVSGIFMQMRIRFWRIKRAYGRKIERCKPWRYDGQHYWEGGTKEHPLSSVIRDIDAIIAVRESYYCPDNPYHYFIICDAQ